MRRAPSTRRSDRSGQAAIPRLTAGASGGASRLSASSLASRARRASTASQVTQANTPRNERTGKASSRASVNASAPAKSAARAVSGPNAACNRSLRSSPSAKRQVSRRTPLRLDPGIIGHCVWRSRWTGRSTTPRAVPPPGCTPVSAWTNRRFASGIVPYSFDIGAPSDRCILVFAERAVTVREVRITVQEIHAAPRDRESDWASARRAPSPSRIPEGNQGPRPRPERASEVANRRTGPV